MQTYFHWIAPIALLVLLAPFSVNLDLTTTKAVFVGKGTHTPLLDFLFHYGPWPITFLGYLGLLGFMGSYLSKKLLPFRMEALYVVLVMVLGSGLVVNGLFKEYWGRPRPVQTVEYGGDKTFRPFYSPNFSNQGEPAKSFPCGHASFGFSFLSLMVLGRRRENRMLWWSGVTLTVLCGGGLGMVRVMMGGHYLSDVIAAGVMMWYVAMALEIVLFDQEEYGVKYRPRQAQNP